MRSEQSAYKLEKLSALVDINIGKTPARKESSYWNGSNTWLSIADMKGDKFIDVSKEHISDEGVKRSGIKSVQENTLLFSFKLSIGKVAITRKALFTNEAIASFPIQDDSVVHQNYLYYVLKELDFTGTGDRAVMGKTLNKAKLKELKIPLPPLAEQKKIAAILDAADKLRQKDAQLIDKYNSLSQSLFLDMFGDPVSNPMGWNKVKMGDVCGVGSSKRVFVNQFVVSGIPFYRGTEVGKLGNGEKIQPHLFISNEHYEQLKEKAGVPQVGDLLLPSICHDGRIWRVSSDKPFYFKDGRVLWIKTDKNIVNSEYLKAHLKGVFRVSYSSIASGTTFAELKIVSLKGIQILFPPLELQNQFAEGIQHIEAQKQQAQAALQKSDDLFNSLLQRAFKGELTA